MGQTLGEAEAGAFSLADGTMATVEAGSNKVLQLCGGDACSGKRGGALSVGARRGVVVSWCGIEARRGWAQLAQQQRHLLKPGLLWLYSSGAKAERCGRLPASALSGVLGSCRTDATLPRQVATLCYVGAATAVAGNAGERPSGQGVVDAAR
jgi:hypothetical protein